MLGMTQQALGAALGISLREVQEIEAGTHRLSARRLYELSCTLGVPVTFFFEGPHSAPAITAVAAASLPEAAVDERRTLSSALRLLLAVVDLADRENGIDDDYYRAAKSRARAALAENARDRTTVDMNIIDD
jgi:transcriptional regulator with XRE-family HTH domain